MARSVSIRRIAAALADLPAGDLETRSIGSDEKTNPRREAHHRCCSQERGVLVSSQTGASFHSRNGNEYNAVPDKLLPRLAAAASVF
ncbi:hypothetical protein HAX54_033696 [Datura stramonium]|uniref:Uncharacterized protein n=1 Tax=Datura stramonium TaxID=4076 RepID=A0ABS8VCQ9_DATST|nr:hypothetical protein [Datura stramonium]